MNWRGYVAPGGLPEDDQQELVDIVTEMVGTEHWQNAVQRNRWKEAFLTGDEFGSFLRNEQQRVTTILQDLGLA